ncbi:MAG: mersacidin/lichenicidin family type 2 lantibiotic [bacterium]|nr:mersacidin/lichenicidin family type 2 lantibiotic [bacterium]
MKKEQIVKAWKNAEYRETLTETERSAMPGHPCGLVELDERDLGTAAGGTDILSIWLCPTDGCETTPFSNCETDCTTSMGPGPACC